MTLVVKSLGATAPAGAKKLYRDALVEDGTLLLVDFSNRGTLNNFSVRNNSKVFDLAREASSPKGINIQGEMKLNADIPISLTEGKGFTLDVPDIPVGVGQGMYFNSSSMMEYLATNQPHAIWVGWLRTHPTEEINYNGLVRTIREADNSIKNVRMNVFSGLISPTFGGVGHGGVNITQGELVQFAAEFRPGQQLKIYINCVEAGSTNGVATGFVEADDFGIGMLQDSYPNKSAFYRTFIEDLDVSGRSVEEILQKDWDYVHGSGEFEGIAPRPFVDNY